ncbi:MAG TPA: hypothetical protein VG184_01125 [Acidimicrobiales bacterium]|nr:hypothetical protein [Acidimicrobiales bacterium]
MRSDPTGLLIIRTWIEEGSTEPIRAHLRISTDVSVGFERTLILTRAEDVCAAVQKWLDDMVGDARPLITDENIAPPG